MVPMNIDTTASLMPLIWGMETLLIVSVAAIASGVVLPRVRRWARRLRPTVTVAVRPALSGSASR